MNDRALTYDSFVIDMKKAMSKLDDIPKRSLGDYWIGNVPTTLNFCGMRIINSPHIKPECVGHHVDIIPISKNRSKRVFKKLLKRRRAGATEILIDVAYVFNGNIVASPKITGQLNSAYKIEI